MTNREKGWMAVGLAACAVAIGAVYWGSSQSPQPAGLSPFSAAADASRQHVPVMFDSPPFDFVDQEGRRCTDKMLDGKLWIADFIFTHCAGSCPKVTAQMVELQKSINNPDVRFVSFSVDPDRDDPATLKQYAATNHTGESRWLLLRPPDREAIMQVAKRMAAVAHSAHSTDSILHTDFFILIDHAGKVRGLYDSKDPAAMQRLKADVAAVARQHALATAPNVADQPH